MDLYFLLKVENKTSHFS